MEVDKHMNAIAPWLYFVILLVVAVVLIVKNGGWWNEVIGPNYMPNSILYYIIWVAFLVIFPLAYMAIVSSAKNHGQRLVVHAVMFCLFLFLLLWVIFLYARKDVRLALIFMGLAWLMTLVALIASLVFGSMATGLWALFLIWLTAVWFLVSTAKAKGLNNMYDTLRERFRLNHGNNPTVSEALTAVSNVLPA